MRALPLTLFLETRKTSSQNQTTALAADGLAEQSQSNVVNFAGRHGRFGSGRRQH